MYNGKLEDISRIMFVDQDNTEFNWFDPDRPNERWNYDCVWWPVQYYIVKHRTGGKYNETRVNRAEALRLRELLEQE